MTKKKTPYDYKFIRILGEGSFSSVYLAVDKDLTRDRLQELRQLQIAAGLPDQLEGNSNTTNDNTTNQQQPLPTTTKVRKYAVKVCQKSYIKRQNKQVAIMREKTILEILNQHSHKHLIKLYCTFQDYERLYFVMTYAENGDLLTYMLHHPLSLKSVRTYTLQLVSALEHMHRLHIVHRDLKPENILLNRVMDILITDFGSAQLNADGVGDSVNANADRRNSFVGTAQYVSPEMLKNKSATNKSDLWALGVIIYQLITNVMPFNAGNEYLIYQKIQALDYEYPDNFDASARSLVESLVKLEPLERLGASDDLQNKGYSSITNHPFFDLCNEGYLEKEVHFTQTPDLDQDIDLEDIDTINPGLNEPELLRLLIGAKG